MSAAVTDTHAADRPAGPHLTLPHLWRSEWVKFWSLRSTYWTLAATSVVFLGVIALVSLAQRSQHMENAAGLDATLIPFVAAVQIATIPLLVLGALIVTGEYSTGQIRSTFTAVPAYLQVQAQKHNPIRHEVNLQWSNSFLTIYAFGNFSDIERPTGDGGDVVTFTRNSDTSPSWYYISQVLEWWTDWCCFEVTRQLNAANIAQLLAQIQNGANP